MNIQDLLLPLIQNSPKLRAKLEGVFGQPADHILGAFNEFMAKINSGPGLISKGAEQQAIFNKIYEGGMAMGFTDWESEIMAASIAGYTPMDVCLSFRNQRGWEETTVEKVKALMDMVAPKFIKKGREVGLLPKEEEVEQEGLPKCKIKTSGGKPPWENESTVENGSNN